MSRLLTRSSEDLVLRWGQVYRVVWGKVFSEVVRGPLLVCILGFVFGMCRAWRAVSWQD